MQAGLPGGTLQGLPEQGARVQRSLFRTAVPPQEEKWWKKQHGLEDETWGSGAHSAVTLLGGPMEVESNLWHVKSLQRMK